jgi:excinuclease ABC subunit A
MLALTFDEAKLVFANHRRIHRKLHLACELGLGYLTLGQSSASLSGGESQRIKLVAELATPRKGHTIYLLDEPTTGLHKLDVARLIRTLRELVRLGNSVYVIEHEEDVLMQADQVIEFGPGPGEQGGRIVFQGPPAKLRAASTNWGEVLRLTSGTATNSFLASRRESDQASH